MNIEADISEALFGAIGASITNLPIKFPLRTFTPPNNNRYVEVRQFENNIPNLYTDDSRVYQGVVRLILHWSNDDAGAIVPKTMLDAIANQFEKGMILRYGAADVVIYDAPDNGGMIDSEPEDIIFTLSLSYRCFKPA